MAALVATVSHMQQRAGRLTGTVGGIGAGLIVPFMVQNDRLSARVILGLLLLLSVYAIIAPELGWWYPGGHRVDKASALRSEASQLGREISDFLAERQAYEPGWSSRRDLDEEAARHLWERETATHDRFTTETRSLYLRRFHNRAVAIIEAAVRRGWADSDDRDRVEDGTVNPLMMKEVATTMARIGSPHG